MLPEPEFPKLLSLIVNAVASNCIVPLLSGEVDKAWLDEFVKVECPIVLRSFGCP